MSYSTSVKKPTFYIALCIGCSIQGSYYDIPLYVPPGQLPVLVRFVITGVTGSPTGVAVIFEEWDMANANLYGHNTRLAFLDASSYFVVFELTQSEGSLNILCPTCSSTNYFTFDAYLFKG